MSEDHRPAYAQPYDPNTRFCFTVTASDGRIFRGVVARNAKEAKTEIEREYGVRTVRARIEFERRKV